MSHITHLMRSVTAGLVSVVALAVTAARGDNDAIEGPWGTIHADLSGTASTTGMVYKLGEGPMEEKWRLDVIALGHDRPGGRSSIVFDKDGNLYWISSTGGGTGGVIRLVSVAPDGGIRWFGNDGAGHVDPLGSVFSGASPVVGQARVYGTGDSGGTLLVAAYDKATGKNLWSNVPPPSGIANNGTLTPVLYKGKLYAVGVSDGKSHDVHCIDAETGGVEWSSTIAEVAISGSIVGQMAFVPDAFGAGVHGIYFNGDSGQPNDGISEVYGIQIHEGEATFGWMSDGGKVARSHVIYSEADKRLYTLTWSDYGAQFYIFDPAAGFVSAYQNSKGTGHGFYDVGGLDFDGKTIIGGGFEGYVLRYSRAGNGTISDEVLFKGGTTFANQPFWGETRVLGQIIQDGTSNTILITGTNSLEGCASHVVAVDVTQRKLLWEFDTGNINDHAFLYAGGPIMGPDGKIYYFGRPKTVPAGDPPTSLVAIGPAASQPKPTAGLILVGYQGREILGTAPDHCISTGEIIRCDGACSTGKGLSFQYSVDPPDDVTLVHSSAADPYATIRFDLAGTYTIHLAVQNAIGTAEYVQEVCVNDASPVCALQVTDLNGAPIDDADDDDEIPCLSAGKTALADAGESFGGNLDFAFTVTPSDGVSVDQADSSDSKPKITFSNPGTYTVALTLTNDLGTQDCAAVTICVKSSGGTQKPGDMDQDGKLSLTDAVRLLGHLFLGTFPTLPCEGGTAGDPGAGELALLDVNGSHKIDISDASYMLNFMFTGSNGPPSLGTGCVVIPGCPDNSKACVPQ